MAEKRSGTKTGAKIHLVSPDISQDGLVPPPNLAGAGLILWQQVTRDYEFADVGSIETLGQACFAATRAEKCRELIDQDGEVIRGRNGPREHPLLRSEIASRAFVTRTLAKLGLDLEPVRSGPGRPAGKIG